MRADAGAYLPLLGSLDSNQDLKSQSLPGCHYPTPQGSDYRRTPAAVVPVESRDATRVRAPGLWQAQRRAHLAGLQPFLHLHGDAARTGGRVVPALVATLVALAAACAGWAAVGATLAGASAAHARRVPPLRRAVAAGTALAPGTCAGANLRPTTRDRHAVDTAVLCLIDRERAAAGLGPLAYNPDLRAVALSQVCSMVRLDYFADVRPSGQTPMSLVSVTRYPAHAADIAVGQNIAWGTGALATPVHIVAAWMASPPHREVLLSDEFTEIGVAMTPAVPRVLDAGEHGATYAVELAVRRF